VGGVELPGAWQAQPKCFTVWKAVKEVEIFKVISNLAQVVLLMNRMADSVRLLHTLSILTTVL
jgi:hypothetical protein